MRIRPVISLLSALALTLALAATTAAGGWAAAVMDTPPNEPGGPDQPVSVGFTLLQHGKTPVNWGTTQVVLINDDTGAEVTVDARLQGASGHWVAEVRFPTGGTWRYEVRHELLIEMRGFEPVTVGNAAAAAPVATSTAAGSLTVQPALLMAGAFLAFLLLAGLAAATLVVRHAQPDTARG
jgi:hypothetical protein